MSAMHKQDSPAPTLEHIMSAIAGAEASRDELREMIAAAIAAAKREGAEQMREAAADAGYAAAFGGTDVREVYSAIRSMPLPTGQRQVVRLADVEGREPVAWRIRQASRVYIISHGEFSRSSFDAAEMTPLYAHPVPAVPAGWQPIETAPKDGSAVLVMRNIWRGIAGGKALECNGHNTYVAEWWAGEHAWVCYMDAVSDPVCPVIPTHWMPIPAAPETAR